MNYHVTDVFGVQILVLTLTLAMITVANPTDQDDNSFLLRFNNDTTK